MPSLLCQPSWGNPYRQSLLWPLCTCHSEAATVMTLSKSVCWCVVVHSQIDWQYCRGCHLLPASEQQQQLSPRSLWALECCFSSLSVKVETACQCHLPHPKYLSNLTNMNLQQNSAIDHCSYHKLHSCALHAVICFHLKWGFVVGAKFDLLPLWSYVPCGEQECLPLA